MTILSNLWCHIVAIARGAYIFSVIFTLAVMAGTIVAWDWGKEEWRTTLKK